MQVLKSFEDKHGVMSYSLIKRYNADPLDVVEQYSNGAKHMFRSISESDDIPDSKNKLKHISGIIIDIDGNTTGEHVTDYDIGEFDQRISNLNEDCDITTDDVDEDNLNVGDVIIDMTDFTVRTFNG